MHLFLILPWLILVLCGLDRVHGKPHFKHGPKIVYRGTTTPPDVVLQRGGFQPRNPRMAIVKGYLNPFSLYNHGQGQPLNNAYAHSKSVYVSTSAKRRQAASFVTEGRGYVYHIRPTPNFINLNKSLGGKGFYSKIKMEEQEYSAMGGIRADQIMGWTELPQGANTPVKEYKFTKSHFYNRKYDKSRPSGPQPQLAGFPENSKAWRKRPWKLFHKEVSGKTLEEYAMNFMADNGKIVGWTGSPPLLPMRSPNDIPLASEPGIFSTQKIGNAMAKQAGSLLTSETETAVAQRAGTLLASEAETLLTQETGASQGKGAKTLSTQEAGPSQGKEAKTLPPQEAAPAQGQKTKSWPRPQEATPQGQKTKVMPRPQEATWHAQKAGSSAPKAKVQDMTTETVGSAWVDDAGASGGSEAAEANGAAEVAESSEMLGLTESLTFDDLLLGGIVEAFIL
ncbi:putative enterotoxin [Ophiocordyceps australis]|uniref:Putative enterotoxin n=1 Tax=Ophiocordyceps australis TaxID=1399860 RepID=A0A2C5YWR0_9HYPO|nr:putative enterotoxin [Ophiocordyceps australis]